MSGPNSCGKCPARWHGQAMCHCRSCHLTFSGVTAFDMHRAGSVDNRSCTTDRLAENRPGVWGQADERQPPWLATH